MRVATACFALLLCCPTDSTADWQISYSSINRYAFSTTDFEEIDDIRNFTSEALFAQSEGRLGEALTKDQLESIARVKKPFETYNLARLDVDGILQIDAFYKYRHIDDAQITDFRNPDTFNAVELMEYGGALQGFVLPKRLFFRASYRRAEIDGLIETQPDGTETGNTYEVNGAAFIPVLRDLQLSIYPTYAFQDIDQDIADPFNRRRHIGALSAYLGDKDRALTDGPRPVSSSENILQRRFDPRGLKLFGGYVIDWETFGDTDVVRQDVFLGYIANLGRIHYALTGLHATAEPTLFMSEVEGDESQDNKQVRAKVSLFYDGLPPLDLAGTSLWTLIILPAHYDVAIDGLNSFENWRAGLEIRSGIEPQSEGSWTRMVRKLDLALAYDHQSFFRIDDDLDLFSVRLDLELAL